MQRWQADTRAEDPTEVNYSNQSSFGVSLFPGFLQEDVISHAISICRLLRTKDMVNGDTKQVNRVKI